MSGMMDLLQQGIPAAPPDADSGAPQGGMMSLLGDFKPDTRSKLGVGEDLGKTAVGSLVEGVGNTARGVGEAFHTGGNLLAKGLNTATGSDFFRAENPLDAAASATENTGQQIKDSRSDAAKQAEQDSTPEGSLFGGPHSLGKNPSIEGYLHQGLNLLGQAAPGIIAAVATDGAAVPALLGGAQMGGGAAKQVRDTIASLNDQQLAEQSKAFRELVQGGMDPKAARQQVSQSAEQWAFNLNAPLGALGGAVTHTILGPAGNALSKAVTSRVAQAGVTAGLEATDQAAQGVAGGVATNAALNQGAGMDKSLTEGSLANALMGVLAGGVTGAARGVMGHGAQAKADESPMPQSRALVDQAFADVKGAGDTINQQQDLRAKIAVSLAGMDEPDRATAIQRIAGGDEKLATTLHAAAADSELIAHADTLPLSDDSGLSRVDVNELFRKESGLINDEAVAPPTEAQVGDAINQQADAQQQPQQPQTNSAGYVPEPNAQIQAQVDAVKQGRIQSAVFAPEQLGRIDVNGLQVGHATDPHTGQEAVVVAHSPDLVQQAVARTNEVGLQQAMGEAKGYVSPDLTSKPAGEPVAVVQQRDNQTGHVLDEQVVRPQDAGKIQRVPDTSLHFTDPVSALASRAEQANTQAKPDVSPFTGPETAAPAASSFHGGERPTPVEAGRAPARPTERTAGLAKLINDGYGLKGDQAINPKSIHEVPAKGDLGKLARAIKWATGTDVVFFHLPEGKITRENGEEWQSVHGVADPAGNRLYMSADRANARNTLAHELTHIMERAAPKAYAKLEDVVFSRLRAERAHELRRTLEKAIGQEGGDRDQIASIHRRELVAEAIGELAQKPEFWKETLRAVGEDRGVMSKLMDVIDRVVARFNTAFKREGYTTGTKDMGAVTKAFQEAYREWAGQHGEIKPEEKTAALGYNPEAGTMKVFPDGTVALNGEQELTKRYQPQAADEPKAEPEAPAAAPAALGYSPQAGTLNVFRDGTVALNGEQEFAKRYQPQGEPKAPAAEAKPEAKPKTKPKTKPKDSAPVAQEKPEPTPEQPAAKAKPDEPAKQPIKVASEKRVKGDVGEGSHIELTLSNGETVKIQRLNSVEAGGLGGWHDIIGNIKNLPSPGGGWLADTKPDAIRQVLDHVNSKADKPEAPLLRRAAPDTEAFRKWFGGSKVVDEAGKPLVMYHGTAQDIGAFRAKQAGAIFVTPKPTFAAGFADASRGYMVKNYRDILTPEHVEAAKEGAIQYLKDDGIKGSQLAAERRGIEHEEPTGAGLDAWQKALADQMPSGDNVMPLYVKAENPFDYENAAQLNEVARQIKANGDWDKMPAGFVHSAREGAWSVIESASFQKAVRDLGHDGFYAREGGVKNLAVYDPTQLKSATGNRGSFDPANPDISLHRNLDRAFTTDDLLDMTRTGKLPYTLGDALQRYRWAESFRLAKDPAQRKQLMRDIGDWGVKITADILRPVYRWAEQLPLSNLTKQRLKGDMYRATVVRGAMEKEVQDRFTNKMFDAIGEAAKASKLPLEDTKALAGYWMTAKYAPKANKFLIAKDRAALMAAQRTGDPAKIAEATQNLKDRISDVNGAVKAQKVRGVAGGMNDAEAKQFIQNIEAKIDPKLLQKIADPVYDMLQWRKAKDLESGRVSQTMVNSWPNERDYVPLTGDPRATPLDDDVFNAGNQLNQSSEKAMKGRSGSISDNGITAALEGTVRSINFAAIQDFKRSLMQAHTEAAQGGHSIGMHLDLAGPQAGQSHDSVIYRDVFKNANGTEEQRAYKFTFDDPRILAALKKDALENTPSLLKWPAMFTRLYGRAATQFTTFFAPLNFVRDTWERTELLRTRDLYDAQGGKVDVSRVANQALADSINPEVWRAAIDHAWQTGRSSAVRNELEEMLRLGGNAVWGGYLQRETFAVDKELRRHLSLLGSEMVKKGADFVGHKVHGYNEMFEVVPSLTIYRALKGQGMTPKDAAAGTLDLMNFKKRGAMMPAVRALYVFAQPNAISAHNLARYLSTPIGRKRFVAQAAIGGLMYAAFRQLWGEEDDPALGHRLDNISMNTLERSVPVKLGGMMVKLPMGYGPPQMAWVTAALLHRFATGRYTPSQAFQEAAFAWSKAVAPVSPSDVDVSSHFATWLIQSATPIALKPIVNISQDTTAMGGKLTPYSSNPNLPAYEQPQRTTAPFYADAAKHIHDVFGVDMYPDQVKALTDGYLIGAAHNLLQYVVDNPAKVMRGEPGSMAVFSPIVENVNDRSILNSIYYRVRGDLQEGAKQYNSNPEENDILQPLAQSFKMFENRERELGSMRSALKKAAPNMDPDELAERTQAIEQRGDELHKSLLRTYFESK